MILKVDILLASQYKNELSKLSLPEFINSCYLISQDTDNKQFNRCVSALEKLSNKNNAKWVFFPSTIDSVQTALIYGMKNKSYIINGLSEWEYFKDKSTFVFKKAS